MSAMPVSFVAGRQAVISIVSRAGLYLRYLHTPVTPGVAWDAGILAYGTLMGRPRQK